MAKFKKFTGFDGTNIYVNLDKVMSIEIDEEDITVVDTTGDQYSFPLRKDLTGTEKFIEGTKAICILQTPTYRLWAEAEDVANQMNWHEAQEYCKRSFNFKGYCPNRAELLWFNIKFHEYGNVQHWYWTCDTCNSYYSWYLNWNHGSMDYDYCNSSYYVRAFYKEFFHPKS